MGSWKCNKNHLYNNSNLTYFFYPKKIIYFTCEFITPPHTPEINNEKLEVL